MLAPDEARKYKRTGVLICGHGSSESAAAGEFLALARGVARLLPDYHVEAGFLEFNTPDILTALGRIREAGCRDVLAIPGTLFAATHTKDDIPAILQCFARQFSEVKIRYGRELGADTRLIEAACARIKEAAGLTHGVQENTALLLAARGAADTGALSGIQHIAISMGESLHIPHVRCAYAGLAEPLFAQAIEELAAREFARIMVMPFFLSGGKLVRRIYEQTDAIAARYPATQFVKASYLGSHPLVIACFVGRVMETAKTGIRIDA